MDLYRCRLGGFETPVDEEGLAGRECELVDPDGNRLRVATRRAGARTACPIDAAATAESVGRTGDRTPAGSKQRLEDAALDREPTGSRVPRAGNAGAVNPADRVPVAPEHLPVARDQIENGDRAVVVISS